MIVHRREMGRKLDGLDIAQVTYNFLRVTFQTRNITYSSGDSCDFSKFYLTFL